MSSVYKIASRGSALALWQARAVQDALKTKGIASEIMVVRTSGDRIQDKALHIIGGKGVFVKELEQALLAKTADLAVHSLKDLPAQTREPFLLACYLERDPSDDVIIFSPVWKKRLGSLDRNKAWLAEDVRKLGALKVGTGSLRRESLLLEANPQIKTVAIRGNVDTRLTHLREGKWDAIVLSRASIHRLALAEDLPHFVLDPSWFVPCAGQGVVVVETLSDSPLVATLRDLSHPETEIAVTIERKVLAHLGGDCTLPIGVHVFKRGDEFCCDLVIFNEDGGSMRMYMTQGLEFALKEFADLIWVELRRAGVENFLTKKQA